MNRSLVATAALALVCACSSSQARPGDTASGDSADAAPRRTMNRDRNVITRAEIDEATTVAGSLYDYIISRHSDWLRTTGGRMSPAGPSSRSITVYVDGQRYGMNPETTRQIPINSVYLARRLSPSEAAAKYGLDNNAGTIEVFTSPASVR